MKAIGVLALVTITFSFCTSKETKGLDEAELRSMINVYNQGWLRNDSAAILNLFDENAILIPSGLNPVIGKREIINFWWPNDSSTTKIDDYKITVLEVDISGDLGYVYETGKLAWSYEKGDFKMSKKQESHEITIFRKNNGFWKIVKRIWTDLKE